MWACQTVLGALECPEGAEERLRTPLSVAEAFVLCVGKQSRGSLWTLSAPDGFAAVSVAPCRLPSSLGLWTE